MINYLLYFLGILIGIFIILMIISDKGDIRTLFKNTKEYFDNVAPNYTLDYNNIHEKTGYDAIKFLISLFYNTNEERFNMSRSERKKNKFVFPKVYVHSANPIGSANIIGYCNNFLMNEGQDQSCVRVRIEHK